MSCVRTYTNRSMFASTSTLPCAPSRPAEGRQAAWAPVCTPWRRHVYMYVCIAIGIGLSRGPGVEGAGVLQPIQKGGCDVALRNCACVRACVRILYVCACVKGGGQAELLLSIRLKQYDIVYTQDTDRLDAT